MSSEMPSLPPVGSKSCKYSGVTFRASRDKYQSRIYKGNKEYNLGLFDVAADAALAYDVAHRLVKRVFAVSGKEKETLAAYEAHKDALDWLDGKDTASANKDMDPDKLNFWSPHEYKEARENEIKESEVADTRKHRNCPGMDELRFSIRRESIRIVRNLIDASNEGNNNRRRKRKRAPKNSTTKKMKTHESPGATKPSEPSWPYYKAGKTEESLAQSGSSGNTSPFSTETLQAGNTGGNMFTAQSPNNYREFFKTMRNMGAMGGQRNVFAPSPEEFQRMMHATEMRNGMGSNMAMVNPFSMNGGNMNNYGFSNSRGNLMAEQREKLRIEAAVRDEMRVNQRLHTYHSALQVGAQYGNNPSTHGQFGGLGDQGHPPHVFKSPSAQEHDTKEMLPLK